MRRAQRELIRHRTAAKGVVTPSQQRAEALLAEALVVGENISDAASVHACHGNAVGERVPLVRPALAVSERGEERVVGLNDHLHVDQN